MNKNEIKIKLKEIFYDVLGFEGELEENLSPENMENWDSLGHVNLMMAIQMEYNVEFEMDELQKIKTVGHIINALEIRIAT